MKVGTKQRTLDISYMTNMLKVSVEQFYGIEIEDFPCQIAQVGMWLMDHQMNLIISKQFGQYFARLPLTKSAKIVHDNALRIDWENVVPKYELSYILGNPPFLGYAMQSSEQKAEAVAVFGKIKLSHSLDYVGAWFHKAAAQIMGSSIKVAFVATNSITQGEQVAPLWEKMISQYGIHINFGYRTFKWSNEGKGKAAVHCVIIGFSSCQSKNNKIIHEDGMTSSIVENINPYLIDAPNVMITSRSKPLCDVPKMFFGNMPNDGGYLILSPEERNELILLEPKSADFIKPFVGSDEFINGGERYCIWLKGVAYSSLKNCFSIQERIKKVREVRLKSTAVPTIKKAETPHLFFYISQPETDYLLIPSASSSNREYISP